MLKLSASLLCMTVLFFTTGATFSVFHAAFAEEKKDTQIGRYLTVDDKPKHSQIDLLSQIIQVRFPQKIQTVGEAMDYVLRLSGYSLVPANNQNNALKTTLSKPLPAIDRDFGPMPLKDGLSTLIGPAFYLVQDPINRVVDFRLKPQFIKFEQIHDDKKNTRMSAHQIISIQRGA